MTNHSIAIRSQYSRGSRYPKFAQGHKPADTLGVQAYFCDPYAFWQRRTNEHFDGRIRRCLPARNRFDEFTQGELEECVAEISYQPRRILGWFTAAEIFQELCWERFISQCVALLTRIPVRGSELSGVLRFSPTRVEVAVIANRSGRRGPAITLGGRKCEFW